MSRSIARGSWRAAVLAALLVIGGVAATPTGARAATFGSQATILIPESQGPGGSGFGVGDPYPLAIKVFGLPGAISNVTVDFGFMAHNWPEDIDLLLVGPEGQQAMLMSDACGGDLILNQQFSFDDAAAAGLPAGSCVTGRYQPTNYEPDANLPAPAPPFEGFAYPADLFAFEGTNPNGIWRLFPYDDSAVQGANGGTGGISGAEVNIRIPAKCRGRTANLVGANGRADFLTGKRGKDVIQAFGGADFVAGKRGRDVLCGGKGRDAIFGGAGRDLLVGGKGRDRLVGGKGNDRCIGGPGRDRLENC